MTISIEVGFAIPERVVLIDRQMLKAYADASGDQNPIHQSEEFAISVGLPNVIAHGMLTMALLVNMSPIGLAAQPALKSSALALSSQ